MATVNRPPFWVPRPPDDNIWAWNPPGSWTIRELTQQKVFGAGGQVPTKFWLPYYTLNDPPEWQGAPIHSQSLVLTTTELKWYAAPGQVPTKRWLPQYTQDDPPPWAPTPDNLNSAIIALLTHQQIFGAGGQVPPSRWNFNYDETPPWAPTADNLNSNIITQLTHQQFYGAGGQGITKNWAFPFSYDDPPMWQGSPVYSQSLVLTKTELKWYGAPGQVPPARWNFNYDETGPWQWTVQERNPNLLTVSAAHNPFTPVPWLFNYDETPSWAAQPVATNIDFIPVNVPRAAFYALKPGDEHFWQPAVQRNVNLLPPVTQNPFIPVSWRFNYDETGSWQFAYHHNANLVSSAAAQNPFLPVPWQFNYDETSLWLGKPIATNVNFIPFLTPAFALWIDDVDDPPTWQWAHHRNLNINTGTTAAVPGVPRIWTFRTDPDDVGWIGQPVAVNINFVPINIPRAAFYALRAGDEQVWAAAPRAVSPAQFPALPPVNVLNVYRWWFNYDQDPMWQGQPLPGLIVNVPIPPVVGPGVYNTLLLSIPNGMFMIPGNPPS